MLDAPGGLHSHQDIFVSVRTAVDVLVAFVSVRNRQLAPVVSIYQQQPTGVTTLVVLPLLVRLYALYPNQCTLVTCILLQMMRS